MSAFIPVATAERTCRSVRVGAGEYQCMDAYANRDSPAMWYR
jgi:hypothetical protein